MKKQIQNLGFIAILCLAGTMANAQQKLIYYWDFNNFNSNLSVGVNPATLIPIHSSWSSLDSTKATIAYKTVPGTSKSYLTYWDNNPGDTLNIQNDAPAGLALRVRNPSDSMQLLFTMPTTHYKNITLAFETEKSSLTSGMGKQVFDYSTDGGTTWKTSGLSIPSDSLTAKTWGFITVSLATDTTINNNSNFIFRMKFKSLNTGTSGNNRFDNVTLKGDTDKAVANTTPPASQILIDYFHFNNFAGLTGAGSPSLITPIHANWSSVDSTKALISYVPAYSNLSTKYQTYWDIYPMTAVDSNLNTRFNTPAGNALRVRNPSDSMELLFAFPTTHYKNITLKYGCEKSSLGSGQAKQVFDYSINGGANWKTSGLSIKGDSITNVIFNLITVSMASDTMINNNPNFIFRIKFIGQNNGTSGNNRFDNLTLEGDTDRAATPNEFSGIEETQNAKPNCNLYPNPATNNIAINTGSDRAKTITMFNMEGQVVSRIQSNNDKVQFNVSGLNNGIYLVNIIENETGTTTNLKLIKN